MLNNNDCDPCEELSSFLYAFADDALEDELAYRLSQHLDTCRHCADRVDAEMHVRELMRKCYEMQAPSSLRARVVASVRVTHITRQWD
ncbi:mycothiol system anti-sigma-R factor [Gleimia europaea]|uniref:mycothiol system anti-sigma-R factor n=1 Tax=Gleimia europaea TaxID=66228 RepID=UPI0027838921|nr:mycothiol system anti-sigma-R factor [Gleimia europaea]MDP9834808.1 anti-sigma factor (TIGR02949 family) [Gleimia europaea]